jgi:hypothetical protein
MPIRGVVGHQIEQQAHASLVEVGDEPVEVGQRAEEWVDVLVVGYVIAEISHRRSEDG